MAGKRPGGFVPHTLFKIVVMSGKRHDDWYFSGIFYGPGKGGPVCGYPHV